MGDWQDPPLSMPMKLAFVLAGAWWLFCAWQAVTWWPRADAPLAITAGVARIDVDGQGEVTGLRIGDGAQAETFPCQKRGDFRWDALASPLLACRNAGGLRAFEGQVVSVHHDTVGFGARRAARLVALEAGDRAGWTRGDSAEAFGWLVMRAFFVGGLLLVVGRVLQALLPGPRAPDDRA